MTEDFSDRDVLLRRLVSIAELMEDQGIGRGDWCDGPAVRAAAKLIGEQGHEIRIRGEILNAMLANIGGEGNCWSNACELDWRQRLRDFASDGEQHRITRKQWETDRGHGITLYAGGGFYTAYFGDAGELAERADDDLPMHHIRMRSDPPTRTCIHRLHLAAWIDHLASIHLPVQIMAAEFDA